MVDNVENVATASLDSNTSPESPSSEVVQTETRKESFLEGIEKVFRACKDKIEDPNPSHDSFSQDKIEEFMINVFNENFSIIKHKPDEKSELCPIEDFLNIRLKITGILKELGLNGSYIDQFCNLDELEKFYREAEKGSLNAGDILNSYVSNITFVSQEQKEFLTGVIKKIYLDSDSSLDQTPDLEQSSVLERD